MTTPTPPQPTTDPLAALRAGVEAHRQSVDAVRQAAAELRNEQQPAPAPAPEPNP